MLAMRQIMLGSRGGAKVPTAVDYVQNGLIAMWDGIENAGWGTHDANATVWKDLAGSRDATLAGNYSWLPNAIHRNSDSSTLITLPSITITTGITFDYCAEILNAGTNNYRDIASVSNPRFEFIMNSNGSLGLYYINSNGGGLSRSIALGIGASRQPKSLTIGFNSSGAYGALNGGTNWTDYTPNTPISPTDYGTDHDLRVGSFSTATFEDANYFSIRLYNRALTADEIAVNYAIDKARFNLP